MNTATTPSLTQAPSFRFSALDKTFCSKDGGEFVTIVGPSGCGKSTLLRILAGLDCATRGHVEVGGREHTGPSHEIGVVLQALVLLPWRNVMGNVLVPAQIQERDPKLARDRAQHYLQLMGLAGFETKYPNELSGGMQQRVGIARTLVNDPMLLLMDEPFGALDAMTRENMNVELVKLRERTGATIMLITHSIPEAVFLSDRVIVMSPRPGRVTQVIEVDLPRATSTTSTPGTSALTFRASAPTSMLSAGSTDDQRPGLLHRRAAHAAASPHADHIGVCGRDLLLAPCRRGIQRFAPYLPGPRRRGARPVDDPCVRRDPAPPEGHALRNPGWLRARRAVRLPAGRADRPERLARSRALPVCRGVQTVPKVAVAPLFVLWFGFDTTSKVVITATIVFFPVLANTIVGLRSAPRDQIDVMRAFTASPWRVFRMVRLPHALPYIFAGLDIGIVLAVIGAIVGEFVGAQAGLGYLILQRNFSMDAAGMFAILIALSVIGLVLHAVVRFIARRVIFWSDSFTDLSRAS